MTINPEYKEMIGKEYWFISSAETYEGFGTLIDIELDRQTEQWGFKIRPTYVIGFVSKQEVYFNPETTRINTRYEQLTPKLI